MGSGTRLKIAEAFSRKCPLVSTSLGAYGYQVQHGRELLLADAATDFAAACVKVIREPAFATAMAERAWSAFVSQWTWDAIQPRIHAAAEAALRLRDEKGNDL
jgi:glycosyltransferase involved in cell wall biosynthesis